MTDDTISRAAAIDALDKRFDAVPMELTTEILQLRRDLRDLPSEQKHGMWIVRYFGAEAKCSECGMYCAGAYDHDRHDNYCRCCGAKMNGIKLEVQNATESK